MDGLREFDKSSRYPMTFSPPRDDKYPAISLTTEPKGRRQFTETTLGQSTLRPFFQATAKIPALRLVCIPADASRVVHCDGAVFQEVMREMGVDPWVTDLIRPRAYGFYHSGRPSDDGPSTYFLGTSFARVVWTTSWHKESDIAVANCLVLAPLDRFDDRPSTAGDIPSLELAQISGLFRTISAFQADSCSALFLPLVLAAHTFRWADDDLAYCLDAIRHIESRTGHGSYGTHFEENRDTIPAITSKLGFTHNILINISKHASIIKSVLDFMLEEHDELEKKEPQHTEVHASDLNILSAARIIRFRASSAEKQCQYLKGRVQNQTSVLFSFLTHQDAEINIEVAHAGRDLAEAARRDGSSMKTIAVLTMLFLPATFLAAVFSMPCLGWDQPEKVSLYWACVVPITVVTFAAWAGITQRGQISGIILQFRNRSKASVNGLEALRRARGIDDTDY